MIQQTGLIKQCKECMLETINYKTVLPFEEASDLYGLEEVRQVGFCQIFPKNFVIFINFFILGMCGLAKSEHVGTSS